MIGWCWLRFGCNSSSPSLVFLLNILLSLLEGGKWWCNSWRNLFPTFVETALPKGGLSRMMLRCRFPFVWLLLVLVNSSLKWVYPLSLRAFSYWYLDKLKISSLEEFLDKRSFIIFGNWLIICSGWFEDLLIYNNKSFGVFCTVYMCHCLSWAWFLKSLQGFYVDSEVDIFKYSDNIFAHYIYLLTI